MTTRPPPARLLRTAAELRALGNAWEKVAADVGQPVKVVKAWPRRYPTQWAKAFDAAVRLTLAEATAEAVLVLRKQLRSEDEKSVREASLKLVQVRTALDKAARPAKGDTQRTSPPGYADRLLAHIRGMTDEEVETATRAAVGPDDAPPPH